MHLYDTIYPHLIEWNNNKIYDCRGRRKRSLYPLSDALVKEISRTPSSYNKYLHLLSNVVQQQQQQQEDEESLQLAAKMAAANNEFGDRNGAALI